MYNLAKLLWAKLIELKEFETATFVQIYLLSFVWNPKLWTAEALAEQGSHQVIITEWKNCW